jgi:lipoprotein-releasing system permease protein
MEGVIVVAAGLALGLPLGAAMIKYVNELEAGLGWLLRTFLGVADFRVFPSSSFLISTIPTRLLPRDVLVIVAAAIVSGLLGALLPAWLASRRDPVECLRHE